MDYDRPHDEGGDWPRHRRRDWDSGEDQDRGRERSRDRDRDRDRDGHRSSWHDSTDGYDRHSRLGLNAARAPVPVLMLEHMQEAVMFHY